MWTEQALARRGIFLAGEMVEIHQRPWSTVFRVPTDSGDVFFKAVAQPFAFEPLLTAAIYARHPQGVPQVFAVDAERRWILMGSGGQTLREAFRKGLGLRTWETVLTLYAGLQIDLAKRVDDLLAIGVRNRSLDHWPALYKDLVFDTVWHMTGEEDGLTADEQRRLVAAIAQVTATCRKLATYTIPESLHHNDLHDANIFYDKGSTLFFDWGDSSIAHPFFSLRTVFVSIENSFGLEEGDPVFDEIARAYLRPWEEFESAENLWAAFRLAKRLWAVSSAVKYKTQMKEIPAIRAEYATAVPGLLREFLRATANCRESE